MTPRAQRGGAQVAFRSEFEGLWIDRTDADEVLARRVRAGQVTEAEVNQLRHFVDHGWVLLEQAVPVETCEEVKRDLRRAFAKGDERVHVLAPGEHFGRPLTAGIDMRAMRVNDIYVYYDSARRALFSPPIVRFLRLIFDAAPLLMQSLTFDVGSRQGAHRDSSYVVVDPPLALAASWTALEDVVPGSGELMYYDGSHRVDAPLFSDMFKCWHGLRDGPGAHDQFLEELLSNCETAGLEVHQLVASEGDTLIWAADLVHGGSPVVDESLTRRSLVGHYCPEWAVPRAFDQFPDRRTRVEYEGSYYSSMHYRVG